MQSSPDHYNWTQRSWESSLSRVTREKVIKPVPHYSPLISDGVTAAVWMPDNMNIYLYDLKIILWLWNDTFHVPLLYLVGTVSKLWLWHGCHLLFFLFFFFSITTYFESNSAVGRSLKQQAWRVKEHVSKFVKEIDRMLLAQDVFLKKLWSVCMQLQ